ncbi:hypothetical protein CY34DRAFT_626605 [Suillus luteus UH-Slu-Lm8-n1]|uniref:Uncharacterized protein n=1 Tax=Suillus luteus UH-Slu-Lm8-n1 TaxID=930992 RepID=A0A0D0AE46_9AGAM|nr:hypothetical protein CY34DRAFT_626605 [Suillus luteus UH-Slu-Lm8-n1]
MQCGVEDELHFTFVDVAEPTRKWMSRHSALPTCQHFNPDARTRVALVDKNILLR